MGSPELRLLLPVEWGGTPIRDSARANPKEIFGQKSQEWVPEPGGVGSHAPNRRAMRTSSEDRARTSQPAGRCQVMEQAPVELGSEVGDCHRRGGPCVDRNAQRVQWACQKRLPEHHEQETAAKHECRVWTQTSRRIDRPIEGPKQRKDLGQMGELETTPSDGPSGVQSQEDHKCGHSRGERWEEEEVACCQEH